jgi:hypothetical protein
MTRLILSSALLLALAACGNDPSGGTATTKLDAVEVQPGTISDSMIVLDDSSVDGTAVDNSVPDDGSAKKAEKKDEDAADDAATDKTDETENPDAVPAPAAKKAVTDAPAKKAATE